MNLEQKNNKKIQIATYVAMIFSFILCGLNLFNSHCTHCHAVKFAALDSIVDMFSSIMSVIVAHVIPLKKNRINPKGWDKLISIFTLINVSFMGVAIIFMAKKSIDALRFGRYDVHNIESGIMLTMVVIILNIILVIYEMKVINETNSLILKSDIIHYSTDIFNNISLIVSMLFIKYLNIFWIDSVLGLLFSIFILISLFPLFKISLFSILDLNNTQKSKIIHEVLFKNGINIDENKIKVFFTGAKYIIEIYDTKEDNEKISKTIHGISSLNNYCNYHNHIGCQHVGNSLTEMSVFELIFINK